MGNSRWLAGAGAAFAVVAVAGLGTTAAHAHPAYTTVPPHVQAVPPPVHTWVPGHWQQRGHGSVWVQGHWVVAQPSYVAPRHPRWHGGHGGRRFDQDRDGIPNRRDRDIDGDGVPNWRDQAPRHPYWR